MLYHRQLDPTGDDSLARLLRKVPASSRVLELGPATGYLTKYLSEDLGCTVDALELSPQMAEIVRPWVRQIVIGDLESSDLDIFLTNRYDVILCADVLEHLQDPWSTVRRLIPLLDTDGRLLLSVPNIGYVGLLIDLMHGNFHYRNEGLLDRSHLRFFTIESLRELLEQADWHLWSAEQVTLSLLDSEFHLRLETISPVLLDELTIRSDAFCYQWVIEARREPPATPCEFPKPVIRDKYQVRLFWKDDEQSFNYPKNFLAWASLGNPRELLKFPIPPAQGALALRLTDRVGFIRTYAMRLFSTDDIPLWAWEATNGILPTKDNVDVELADDHGLWFVRSTESRLVLDLPKPTIALTKRVEIEIGSSLSADFIGALNFWNAPNGLPAQLAFCEASRRRLALRQSNTTEHIATVPDQPIVIHVANAGGGGVERFVRDICNSTSHRFQHFVLRVTHISWLLEESATATFWPFRADSEQVIDLLSKLGLGLVHLHSTEPRTYRVAQSIASRCGISLNLTLHDVLFLDQSAFRTSSWQATTYSANAAQNCLPMGGGFISAPSNYIAELAQTAYPTRPIVVQNGVRQILAPSWNDLGEVAIGGTSWRRRIVSLGALGRHKGGDTLFDIVGLLPTDVVFIIVGFLDGQLETGWANLHHRTLSAHPAASRIFVSGPYAPDDLPALFSYFRPQLVFFPGRTPESFSYTLSETWACGGIPVVPNLGALGERVDERTGIKLNDCHDSAAVAVCLDSWSKDDAHERRVELRQNILNTIQKLVPSLDDMANTFTELYQAIADEPPTASRRNLRDEFSALCDIALDPLQFRTELRLMMDQVVTLKSETDERRRWNEKLEADVQELRMRNSEVEMRLADLGQMYRRLSELDEAQRSAIASLQQDVAEKAAKLATVFSIIGQDEAAWPNISRLVRVAKRIPGFIRPRSQTPRRTG